jgi:hypothetical protein
MDVQHVQREARTHLATLFEPDFVHMAGKVGAVAAACQDGARKIEDLLLLEGTLHMQRGAYALANVLEGGGNLAQTASASAVMAAETGDKTIAAYLLSVRALQEAVNVLQEVERGLITTLSAINMVAEHTDQYLKALTEGE